MASRIGVYICQCGTNIAATVDSVAVAEYAATLPHVVVARDHMYMCSDPGQEMIKQDIHDHDLNRVVVASCSPRMHEVTFRTVVQEAGVNPYYFEMSNIREQCSWVHADRDVGTQKAKELVAGSVAKAALLEPLEERQVDVTPAALVIGGGIAGLESALEIADAGYRVYLVEKEPSLGGRMAQLNKTFPRLEDAGLKVGRLRRRGGDGGLACGQHRAGPGRIAAHGDRALARLSGEPLGPVRERHGPDHEDRAGRRAFNPGHRRAL